METSESQQVGCTADIVAESDSINVASQTQISCMTQVRTMETYEPSESPELDYSQKERETLERRPSYKRILNELSSEGSTAPKIEEESTEDEETQSTLSTMTCSGPIYQISNGQYIAIGQGGAIQITNPGSDGEQGLQTLTMSSSGTTQQGTTVVQYAATAADGTQYYIPSSRLVVQAATGEMPAYQIRTQSSALTQGVVVTASPANLHSPHQLAEEATRKRELRLMKNREAAKACRRRKKEYVKCLETRVAMLELQKKTLIEELQHFSNIYRHSAD